MVVVVVVAAVVVVVAAVVVVGGGGGGTGKTSARHTESGVVQMLAVASACAACTGYSATLCGALL